MLSLSACGQALIEGDQFTKHPSNANLPFTYQYESGRTLQVSYPKIYTAIVEYKSHCVEMQLLPQ